MDTRRRGFLFGSAAALATARLARAQGGQQRPLRIVVPYTPGGSADLMARAFGAHLAARSGRTVVVDNKPGATGTIGTQAVARSAPNGETILQSDMGPMSIQPAAGKPATRRPTSCPSRAWSRTKWCSPRAPTAPSRTWPRWCGGRRPNPAA